MACRPSRLASGAMVALVLNLGPAGAAQAQAMCPIPPPGTHQAPVSGVVVDAFRPPESTYGTGNRGWEYATADASAVQASGAGVVVFAGPIGGRRYVSIDHPGGLRTTYSWLATTTVRAGAAVARGSQIGTTAERFHFGVRCGSTYLDPILLLGTAARGQPHLVPVRFARRPPVHCRPARDQPTPPTNTTSIPTRGRSHGRYAE